MTSTVVRTGQLANVEQIISGYEWLFEPPGSRPPQREPEVAAAALRRTISSDCAVVLTACIDGELVGFCTAYDDIQSVRFGRRAWVGDLAVHPAHRSRGTGKRLLGAARRSATARGATRLELVSSQRRSDAHRFHEREQPDWHSINFDWQHCAATNVRLSRIPLPTGSELRRESLELVEGEMRLTTTSTPTPRGADPRPAAKRQGARILGSSRRRPGARPM